ncbi:receptor-type tyrosine-protein phosphatase alpha-like [Ostrea edulis]|uniref:receptor-type tyrosine-protein phosphatase alpha-like n=1 Tax=Ostrea edulis TaxID=37623 RepID=UPI0024AF9F1F|nr:receptor-type tyrosine-protein phosphatase alpha-like [Ostrea edulis]
MTSEPNTGAIGGGLFATLFALVGIIMLIVLLRYRNVRKRQRSTRSELNAGVTSELNSNHIQEGRRRDTSGNSPGAPSNVQIPNVDVSLECGYYNLAYRGTDIVIDELQRCIATKTTGQNNIFLAEYKKLPPKDVRACCEAQKTENLDKNRFKSTLPYDHSRVVLKQRWSASDNDYINANYIKDTNGEKRYIATQGPRENTVEDFWRLIWQERVKDIVMLTNLVETGKKKCAKYWPDKDKHLSMGRCRVYLSDETIYAFHVVRKLTVERVDLTQRRTITQFHYTAWPDHDIPEELGLIQFHRYVSTRYRPGPPLLVHCSAGVGRSGTYIGLDSLLIQGKEKGRINVFEFVKQMRQDRMIMVQTPEQYVFLHRALHYGFQAKNTVISEHDLPAKAKSLLDESSPLNLQSLYNEYQFLETLIPVYKSEEKDLPRTLENRAKNVDMEILPVSKFRPYLTTYVKGRNEYINAVIVPSFTNPTAFIITQKPLPDTEVDLWRLCVDHEVNVLVVLEGKIQENKWLPTKGLSRKCPPFIITAGNKETHTGGIILDSLQVTQDGDKKNLKVFQVPSRNEDALLKATELLLDREKTSILTTIVMSKNGAGPAGLFCVLHNALQQLRMDGEVDIFTAVKQIQTRRPEIITKLEEYQQCYKLVARPASSGGIYANL